MLYNTGTPSLVSFTRDLMGDPSSAASPIQPTAKVKAFINSAYTEMREEARVFSEGVEVKRSYADTVADQLWYELPADFKKMVLVEVDSVGGDLTASTGAPVVLEPLALDTALTGYETGSFSEAQYVAMGSGHFALIAPVSTAGSNSLRITYESETTELSADGDEPAFPEPHQYLICYKAAVSLKASDNLEHDDLLRLMLLKQRAFRIAMQERLGDNEGTMAIAGLVDQSHLTQMGRLVRK